MIDDLIGIKLPIVLASKSPRRKKLLEGIGLNFQVVASNFDERVVSLDLPFDEYVKKLSFGKALAVAEQISDRSVIIGADTVVAFNNRKLNKPKNFDEAFSMLNELSGNLHSVYTGVAIIDSDSKKSIIDYVKTEVKFRDLEEKEIVAYIQSGSPMDKAGAYGIQDDFGSCIVESINGDYFNVVGLPLRLLYINLKKFFNEL